MPKAARPTCVMCGRALPKYTRCRYSEPGESKQEYANRHCGGDLSKITTYKDWHDGSSCRGYIWDGEYGAHSTGPGPFCSTACQLAWANKSAPRNGDRTVVIRLEITENGFGLDLKKDVSEYLANFSKTLKNCQDMPSDLVLFDRSGVVCGTFYYYDRRLG
jgi:hypothetical protein